SGQRAQEHHRDQKPYRELPDGSRALARHEIGDWVADQERDYRGHEPIAERIEEVEHVGWIQKLGVVVYGVGRVGSGPDSAGHEDFEALVEHVGQWQYEQE